MNRLFSQSKGRFKVYLLSYGLGLLMLGVMVGVKLLANPSMFSDEAPFLIAFVIVIVSTLHGGFKPGLVTTLLASEVIYAFFYDTVAQRESDFGVVRLTSFVFKSVLVSLLIDRLAELRRREMAKKKLADDSKLRMENLLSNIPGLVWEIKKMPSGKLKIKFVNDYPEKILGVKKYKWISNRSKWLNRIHPEDRHKFKEYLNLMFLGKTLNAVCQCKLITKSGKLIWMETRMAPISPKAGNIKRIQGVSINVTERVLAEKKRDEFIGVTSHELKTPLTTIKAYAQLLEKKISDIPSLTSELTYVKKMNKYVENLNNIITDFLDYSKIKSGKMKYNMTEIEVVSLLKTVVEDMLAVNNNRIIIDKMTGNVRAIVDSARISQVFINLISNALKYSNEDSKVIITNLEKGDYLITRVKDRGVGISLENQRRIFEKYYRVEENGTTDGFGLGLFIASQIIRRHGGKIWVESNPGKGSVFSFSIRVKNGK